MQGLKAVYEERLALFHKTVHRQKTDRVPLLGTIGGYALAEEGYPYLETLRNWDAMKEVILKHEKKYGYDTIFHPGSRNPIRISEAFGGDYYLVDDDSYSITVLDRCLMAAGDYNEIISNRVSYLWETFLPAKTGNASPEQLREALKEFMRFGRFGQEMLEALKEECGMIPFSKLALAHPLEPLFHGMRGIRGFSLDLRKQKDLLKQYTDSVMTPEKAAAQIEACLTDASKEAAFDIHMPMLAQTVMNPKQFDEQYWPLLRSIIEAAADRGGTVTLFMEGDNTRFWDHFQDIPRGHVTLWLEQDDLFEAKKKIGEYVTLAGGYPVDQLTNATPEACVKTARSCVENLAPGGGWIFAIDKGLAFKRDARRENLEAVMEYMHSVTLR